jgi:membrane protein DedA with SNARE-associated domain/membrane-associated phospholipid phosphatase
MGHLVDAIVAFAQAHRVLAYALAFVLAGGESFPVFGAAVPGTATIVAFGALVPSGALQFWPLVLATLTGAIAGDGFSYWLGHHYRAEVARVWPLRRHPGLIDQGNAFFARHGGKAIIAARFTPGVRAIVPLVAGVAGMPAVRFYAVNVFSAVLWAPSHVVMGVLIGASLAVLGAIAGRLVALVFAIFLLLALAVWLTPRAVRWLVGLVERLHGPVRAWASRRDTWLRRQVLSLIDPSRPEARGLLALGALLIGALWLFFAVLQDVIAGDPLVRADRAVFQLLQSLRVDALDRIAIAVTGLGDPAVIVAVTLVAVFWLLWRRAWRAALYTAAAVVGGALFGLLLKVTIERARPGPLYTGWHSFAFPSGHAAVSTALYGFLAILIARDVGMRSRIATALSALLLVSAIGLSRLYLGAHWLSDVIAGFAFGLAWIALLGIAYLQRRAPHIRPAVLMAAVAATLLFVGSIHFGQIYRTDMERYAVRRPSHTMILESWLHGGWTELPAQRFDLLGEYEEPFTIQWAGSLDSLRSELIAHGWKQPLPWTLRTSIEWLSPQASPTTLPVLPQLNGGRSENLTMVRTGGPVPDDQRLVLRLWRSDVSLSDGPHVLPLWIGTVVTERVTHIASLLTIAKDEENLRTSLRVLHDALPSAHLERRKSMAGSGEGTRLILLGEP